MQNKPSRQWTLLHAFMKQTESHTYINLFRQSEHSDYVVHKIHQLNHNSLKKNNYIEHFEALKKLGLRRLGSGCFVIQTAMIRVAAAFHAGFLSYASSRVLQ